MNLVGWWGITIPLAVYLGLHEGLGTWGFWAALAAGTSMQVKGRRSRCHNQVPSSVCYFAVSSMHSDIHCVGVPWHAFEPLSHPTFSLCSIQAGVFLGVLLRLDWDKELERAHALVESHREEGLPEELLASDLEGIVDNDDGRGRGGGLKEPLIQHNTS